MSYSVWASAAEPVEAIEAVEAALQAGAVAFDNLCFDKRSDQQRRLARRTGDKPGGLSYSV